MNNNLSKNIAKQRHTMHLTQEKLAEKADMSVNFLSKLERGASKTVSAETLQHLANALDVSMEELMSGTEKAHLTKGPYEIKLSKLLDSYSQGQREAICKGLLMILNAQKH